MGIDPEFNEPCFESSCAGPPSQPGVYAVCVMRYDVYMMRRELMVVYIGSSENIAKRVLNTNHYYRRLFSLLKSYLVTVLFYECSNFLEEEQSLIKKYHPRFNRRSL